MDESVYLLEPVLGAEKLDKKFSLLLEACEEQQAFALKPIHKIQEVVATINRRLNASESRRAGLLLLKTFLPQCSDDVFQENALQWMGQCLKEARNAKSEEASYEVLRMMLQMSSNFPELTKPFSATIIPKFLEQTLKLPPKDVVVKTAVLQCLEVVLHYYGGPCKTSKGVIRKFLLTFIQEEDPSLVYWAGRCISYIPLIGGGGTGSTKHRSAWSNQLQQLCVSVNKTLDELYANVTELHLTPILGELGNHPGIPLPDLGEESPVISAYNHATILCNLLQFVEAMLSGALPIAKEIQPNVLLALACRGLAVNCATLGRGASIERVALVSVLPRIHTAFLSMLRSLVISCGSSLIRSGPLICKLVLQTLKWTAMPAWSFGTERPYRRLREAACALLESWLVRVPGASFAEVLADHLVPQLLADISQTRTAVTLQVQNKKNVSKRQHQELRQTVADNSEVTNAPAPGAASRVRLADARANAGPCQAALRVLCCLVQAVGPLIKPTLHRQMQEAVLGLLLEVQCASSPEDLPAPYAVVRCRVQLYRLLLELTVHPHSHWPPPTQFALTLFAAGQHDQALEVAGLCSSALASVRQMVHPSNSAASFPISLSMMRKNAGVPVEQREKVPAAHGVNETETEAAHEVISSKKKKKQHQLSGPEETGVESSVFQDSGLITEESVQEVPNGSSEGRKKRKRKRKRKEQAQDESYIDLTEADLVDLNGDKDNPLDTGEGKNGMENKKPEEEQEIVFDLTQDEGESRKDVEVEEFPCSESSSSKGSPGGKMQTSRNSQSPIVELLLESSDDSSTHASPSTEVNIVEVDLAEDSRTSLEENGKEAKAEGDPEPTVELVDSDSSFVLRLEEEDDEVTEVQDGESNGTNDFGGEQSSGGQEETAPEIAEVMSSRDRDLEEDPVGMDAVEEAAAVERTDLPVDGEPAAKKARVEEASGSTVAKGTESSDEEDILNSFVDVIAPNSATTD